MRFLRGEFPEQTVGADVAGIMLKGGSVGQAGQKVTDSPAHTLLFDAQGRPIRDEMRMKMIKFEETLEDLTGALVDVPNSRVVVKVLIQKSTQVLDFYAHRQSESDKTTGKSLGIGGGGGPDFCQQGVGGAGGIFDKKIGQTAGDITAGTFGIESGVVLSDGGLGFLPKLDVEQGCRIDQATFEGIFKVVAGVGDFVRKIDDLGF